MEISSGKYPNEGKRTVCGGKEINLGEAVVITGEPREFKPGVITYINQRQVSYENHMTRKLKPSK